MKKEILIIVFMLMAFVSCKTRVIMVDGMLRDEIMKLSEAERVSIDFSPEARSALYRYKYSQDLKLCQIKGDDRAILKQLYELSLPEAFLPGENETKTALNKIGSKIDSLHWNDLKSFLFIGTTMTIKEFKESLPANYRLTDDYMLINTQDNKECSLSEYLIEYKSEAGRGGIR